MYPDLENNTTFLCSQIPEAISEEIQLCNAKMNYKQGELLTIICQLAQVMSNQAFIDQMLEINEDICRMCLWQQDGVHNKMADASNAGNKADTTLKES